MDVRADAGGQQIDEARRIEPALKRALYSAVERLQATKAALYLAKNHGGNDSFEIVTSYGYNAAGRATVDEKDPIVARLLATGVPLLLNDLATDAILAEVLFTQGNTRMLAVPIFGRGRRMVGIVDFRDKAGRRPFDTADTAAAATIREEIERALAARKLYGVGAVQLVDAPKRRRSHSARYILKPDGGISEMPIEQPEAPSAAALEAIRSARERMERRGVNLEERRRLMTAEELDRVAILLPALLPVSGVVAAALTSHNRQSIVSAAPFDDEALALLNERIAAVMNRETPAGAARVLRVATPSRRPLTREDLRIVANAPVVPRLVESLVLTIALDRTPDDDAREQIEMFNEQLSNSLEALIGRNEWGQRRVAVAEALIEPDFRRLPMLASHSRLVAGIAQRFALALKLPDDVVETIRIAALVHDVGLRLLDYEKTARKGTLANDQMRMVMEHPLVGAALVEPLLGSEVAEIVLRHHERFDGKGYPGRVPGSRIAVGARIIAIADAWAAMTSPDSYLPAISHDEAMQRLRDDAGAQFDPSLVGTFLASVEEISS